MAVSLNDLRTNLAEVLQSEVWNDMQDSVPLGSVPSDGHVQEAKRILAILNAMTSLERRTPSLVEASRLRRIASGAGVQPAEVGKLLQYGGLLAEYFDR